MAQIINTSQIANTKLTANEQMQVYNGLDSLITNEIQMEQAKLINAELAPIYNFEMSCLAPALELTLRGTKVDIDERNKLIAELEREKEKIHKNLCYITRALFGADVNPQSSKDMPWLFYEKVGLPKIYNKDEKLSLDRGTLEKLYSYFNAKPFVKMVLAYRDRSKKIQALKSGIHRDNRMRCSYNVGSTETGRWSSSKSSLGGGANDQTWTEELRHIFIPDEGMELFNVDLEQAEARAVAYLAGDEAFIEACESGDLWTTVCKMVWPGLPWTGDLKHDKKNVAEQPFYRHHSYRDMAKRGGHAFDYGATAFTVSKHLKIPKTLAEDFRKSYFGAFKGIVNWQQETKRELQVNGYLITPFFNRSRHFLERLREDSTVREAIAFRPQSLIGDLLNYGLLRLWRKYPWIEPLKQVHDSITGQYPEGYYKEAAQAIKECLEVSIPIHGRNMVVPTEILFGWNWGKCNAYNPHGLKKDHPGEKPTKNILAKTDVTASLLDEVRRTI